MQATETEAGMETEQTAGEAAQEAAEHGTNGNGAPDAGDGERRSLADLANDEPAADDEVEQFTLFGTKPKINKTVGGDIRVTAAAAQFTAKRQPIPGQYELGDTVRGTFVGEVVDMKFPTKKNSDGTREATRVHVVEMTRLSQAEDVPEEFAALDGRGTDPEKDSMIEQLERRVRELESILDPEAIARIDQS